MPASDFEGHEMKVRGLLTSIQETKKGFILSVLVTDSILKVFTKKTQAVVGQLYKSAVSYPGDGSLFFEKQVA